jgi:peptidyl-prolyl cis-trans isomerase B (cyclophilin B)
MWDRREKNPHLTSLLWGGEAGMIRKVLPFLGGLLFLVCAAHPVLATEVRHRKFTSKEIASMKETKAVIHTKLGDIKLAFYPDLAPNHVESFITLAKRGFFDGTTFHRVVPGFVIQGGDPNTKDPDRSTHGMGGPGYEIKAEFSDKPHMRGTLSMARSAHPDSAGSQFFICVADAAFLNGKYTVFGEVTSGMDVVDKIVAQPRDPRDNPVERIEMKVEIIEPKP